VGHPPLNINCGNGHCYENWIACNWNCTTHFFITPATPVAAGYTGFGVTGLGVDIFGGGSGFEGSGSPVPDYVFGPSNLVTGPGKSRINPSSLVDGK